VALLTVAIGVVSLGPAVAQDVTEPSLKAAFVYNFTRFTEWPGEALPAGAPLVACVVTDNAIAAALERMVQGRPVMGRQVSVMRLTVDAQPRGCHLLFVSGLSARQLTPLMASVRGMPVLTIIDSDGLARVPGIARLFVDSGTLRFDIDHGLAKREGLKLSSKLLTLAKKVYDERSGVTP
jgi:hypothetical protein